MVLRDDRELLHHLAQINADVPGLALRLMNGELPVAEQRAFAHRFVDMAEALMAHADRRDQMVLDHHPPPDVRTPASPPLTLGPAAAGDPGDTDPGGTVPGGDDQGGDDLDGRCLGLVDGDQVFNIYDARAQFSRLVQRAADGERIVIARNGHLVARLVSASSAAHAGPALADLHARLDQIQAALHMDRHHGQPHRRGAGLGSGFGTRVHRGRLTARRTLSPAAAPPVVVTRAAAAMSAPPDTAC